MAMYKETRDEIYLAALSELELLKNEQGNALQDKRKQQRRTHSLLAGGILLSSLMSALSVQMLTPHYVRPISRVELEAVNSLVEYIANSRSTSADLLHKALLAHFDIQHIVEIPADRYHEAIEYLLRFAG